MGLVDDKTIPSCGTGYSLRPAPIGGAEGGGVVRHRAVVNDAGAGGVADIFGAVAWVPAAGAVGVVAVHPVVAHLDIVLSLFIVCK